jgi:hypothetical protein
LRRQLLGDRDLAATFFVELAAAQQEPFAVTMIVNARNEIAGLIEPGEPLRALDVLRGAGREPQGASAAATVLGPGAMTPGGAPSWHQALQLAVARAIEHRSQVTLSLEPGLLERAEALGVMVETLDLIAGLRRADRLCVPTLSDLAAWWAPLDRRGALAYRTRN